MSFVDPIGDMITRIRNAQLRVLNNVTIPSSKFRARILDVLKQSYKFVFLGVFFVQKIPKCTNTLV